MERPILFSSAMVRALLAGTKTQTRRIVKGVPSWPHFGRDIMDWGLSGIHQMDDAGKLDGTDQWALDVQTEVDDYDRRLIRCPYGRPGDVLWVRETLRRAPDLWSFAADGAAVGWPGRQDLAGKKRDTVVSIHMPRTVCRLRLLITDVRVERLQDISEMDARAEGASECANGWWFDGKPEFAGSDARGAYYCLWNHINGPGAWAANPWVWAVSFERLATTQEAEGRDDG